MKDGSDIARAFALLCEAKRDENGAFLANLIADTILRQKTSEEYTAEDRIKELENALKPFADAANLEDNDDPRLDPPDAWESPEAMAVTIGDFRHAARVYGRKR